MAARTELIALAIRLLSEKTTLIRQPDPFESFINQIFGVESYDRRLAREIESEALRAFDATKRINTTRKFRSIVKHM